MWSVLLTRLEGDRVALEPLDERHRDGMLAAAAHPEIWTWLGPYMAEPPERFDAWFDEALRATAAGEEAAFATVWRPDGRVIGSTRFLALRPEDRGVEIGWTWLEPTAWRTGANLEAKLLQLTHAFEVVSCMRVELKTHAANQRSRAAMEDLGASFEGVFRKHRIVEGVGVRDSAWYSILDDEWPAVKAGIERRLATRV